ncbi:MAG: PHP domain-containing protein [Anaerolineae bacterium]|nr:PHP domain-containing protein [Anaerolineae bacterium]
MAYHFEGILAARDCKRHIAHRLTLPDGCGRLDIQFRFAPPGAFGVANLITLTLFDPHGFRGAGHRGGDSHTVQITATGATPGYFPGPLSAGEWTVQIDTHMIMPEPAVRYWLDVAFSPDTGALPPSTSLAPRPAPRGAGWYRGDLHCHTHHSDAHGFTVSDLLRAAREYALDFVFLTDHNTVSGLPEMDAGTTAELLAAGGIELTTFWGHALCLGTRDWVDWRVCPGGDGMARIAEATYAAGQVFVIAHPQSVGDPGCTGCAWRYGEMSPGNARLVEVWNGPWNGDSNNEAALALWYDWLNQGLHIVATAGTDAHAAQPPGIAVSLAGAGAAPGFNVVYAEALTEMALLKALRAGHLYLSAGPQLLFQAQDARNATAIAGDTVTGTATFSLEWADCPDGALVRILANGRLLRQWPAQGQGAMTWTLSAKQADWVLVEIRSEHGAMLALSNPIFLRNE